MGCIPWADEYMIRPSPHNEKRRPLAQWRRSSERQDDLGVSLTAVYITDAPKGTGLAVLPEIPASVASAPRGGVACNDAAIRRDRPTIGWVRDARVRSQEKHTNTVNDEEM